MKELRFPYQRLSRRGRIVYQPRIPVYLSYGQKRMCIWPLVDSGAVTTVFNSEVGLALGIDVASGERRLLQPAAGRAVEASFHEVGLLVAELRDLRAPGAEGVAFYHEVGLLITDGTSSHRYTTRAGFSDALTGVVPGVLGQIGFFDKFEVTLDYPRRITVRTRAATSASRR